MLIWFDKDAIQKIESTATRQERIAAIDTIIDTLLSAAASAALNSDLMEYKADTGQTKVSRMFRDPSAIAAAVMSFEKIKVMYVNRQNGRMTRLIDSRNLPPIRWGCY